MTTPPQLSVRDRVMLAQGFYFLFFGALASVVFVAEVTIAILPHATAAMLCGASLMAILVGAWRLHRVRALGPDWTWRTRLLLIAATLLLYLFPFLLAWRRMPGSSYFSIHGFAFLTVFILTMMTMTVVGEALASALGRKGLRWQMILCVATGLLVQLAPLILLASLLTLTNKRSNDTVLLQTLIAGLHPVLVMLWLLPFTLSLSLVWTAKDIAMDHLLGNAVASEDKPVS